MNLAARSRMAVCGTGARFGQETASCRLAVGISIQNGGTSGWYAGSRLPRRPRLGFCVRYAEGIQDRPPSLAEEMVGLKPGVVVAAAVNAAVPAHAATSEIPALANAKVDVVMVRSITDL